MNPFESQPTMIRESGGSYIPNRDSSPEKSLNINNALELEYIKNINGMFMFGDIIGEGRTSQVRKIVCRNSN